MRSSHNDANVLIPIGEVASLLGVTVGTIRRWDKAGRIQSFRTPTGHRRFKRNEVLALLEATAS